MRKTLLTAALLVGGPVVLAAQSGGMGGMGGMRMGPPPNHWMTMDSVAQALSLTDAEKTAIAPQYDSINALLMRAQTVRDSLRANAQGGDFRSMMQAARQVLQPLQDQEDALVKEIHGKISAAAAAKLDAAPPPRVLRQRPPGGMGGGGGR